MLAVALVSFFTQPNKSVLAGALIGAEATLAEAPPGTIRGDLGTVLSENLIHGSDSPESAQRELDLFFKREELLEWKPAMEMWVYDYGKGKPE